ncbi:seipin-like isoform X2 [Dreissena polymorpha]|uniref:Seipin n=1 Tax=Dreissena polymorpha TaxID=45954 RepID=A0A9D4LBF2_DREPO|nr:seipin-like isoform X2 [Dreissena polymorpha]KAH3854980.1 hypothetical protein DPMN_097540 [Dreissena polymorpha]
MNKAYDNMVFNLSERVTSATHILQKTLKTLGLVFAVFWVAVFLYASFYYYYVPVVAQERPVHFQFSVCESGIGICSFPTANVSLSKDGKSQVFNMGQRYTIILELDVPESDINRVIGMFMIEMRLYNKNGETVSISSRSASIQYKSDLLRSLETFMFAPMFLFGYMQQKQYLNIELFPDFVDNAFNPSVGLVLEVKSKRVDIYAGLLKVYAQFSGLRYFLYSWPFTSAFIGIGTNFSMLGFVVLLSWYNSWLPWAAANQNAVVKVILAKNRKESPPKSQPVRAATETVGCEPVMGGDGQAAVDTLILSRPAPTEEDSGLRLRQPRSVDLP